MPIEVNSRTIIFVHGIFGWGPGEITRPDGSPFSYWGDALDQFGANFARHEAKCGPVSSFHDRACEIFAQIKGGDFIYDPSRVGTPDENGAPKRAKVLRSERDIPEPLLPHWSDRNPVILVAHSAGLQTCLTLQRLLAEDYWGIGSNADWVEAVISIAGVINGSTLTYMFGCDPASARLNGAVSSNSQRFPFNAMGQEGFLNGQQIQRGRWYYEHVENVVRQHFDHLDPVFGALIKNGVLKPHQDLYQRLNALLP